MKIKIFVISVVWLLLSFLPATAQNQPCGCADKDDLLNILNQTQMEIQESQFQMNLILAKEKEDGKTIMATDEGVSTLFESIHNAAKSVAQKRYPGQSMNLVDCSVKKTDTFSDCVELIKKHFYDVTQKACLANKSSRGSDQPYYEVMEMKSYLLHIMMAYQAMQDFTLRMLKALPKNCRPQDWFGYIVYQRVKTFVSARNIPPRGTQFKGPGSGVNIINGGSDTSETKETYIGTKLFNGDSIPTSVRGYATVSYNSSKTFNGRTYCSPKRPDESFASTSGVKTFAEGVREDYTSFNMDIYPDQRKYKIGVSFPSVTTIGQSSRFENISGGCDAIVPNNLKAPIKIEAEGGNYGIEGTTNSGSPDYLEGSKSEKPYFQNLSSKQGNTSGTNTYEIQVRWMLRRLPSK